MTWRQASGRNFHFDPPSTPANVGPGSYDPSSRLPGSSRSQSACFKSRDPRSTFRAPKGKSPAPGRYDPFPRDTQLPIKSSLKSDATRTVFTATTNPSPCDHSNLLEWVAKPRVRPSERVSDRPASPMVGQHVVGFAVTDDGTLVAHKRRFRDPAWLGPGRYDLDNGFGGRCHSMQQSYRSIEKVPRNGIPGPGTYETASAWGDRREPRVGRMPSPLPGRTVAREHDPSANAPKSGEMKHPVWEPWEALHTSPAFVSRSRRELWLIGEAADVPGPDVYQCTDRRLPRPGRAAFGKRSRRFERDRNPRTPGPGSYDPDEHKWGARGRAISAKAAPAKAGEEAPGPGTYEPHQNSWEAPPKKQTPVFASGVEREVSDATIGPGPAAYEMAAPGAVKRPSIHASRSPRVGNVMHPAGIGNPAPDVYMMPVEKAGVKGRTIGREARFAGERRMEVPGPGSYDLGGNLIKRSFNSELADVRKKS